MTFLTTFVQHLSLYESASSSSNDLVLILNPGDYIQTKLCRVLYSPPNTTGASTADRSKRGPGLIPKDEAATHLSIAPLVVRKDPRPPLTVRLNSGGILSPWRSSNKRKETQPCSHDSPLFFFVILVGHLLSSSSISFSLSSLPSLSANSYSPQIST